MKAYVTGWFEIPLLYLTAGKLNRIKDELTVTPRTFGDKEAVEIKQYRVKNKRLCVPIEWGIGRFPKAKLIDATAPLHKVKYKKKPSADHPKAPKGQAKFMAAVEDAVRDNFAALAVASTGKGKTVVALWLAAILGVRVLIVTPNTEIMDNWIAETRLHLGIEPGIVQQDRCDIKPNVVIGIIHSLARRDYGADFYNSFGLVVWDEAHVVGAFTFSQTLGKFNSRYKLALTATPRRKDGAEALFLNYFGPGYAFQREKALPADCYTVKYRHEPGKWPAALAILINIITKSKGRNAFLSKWINWMYKRDYHILGLSDRIEQLEYIRDLLVSEYGISPDEIGIVAKQKTTGKKMVYKPTKKVVHGKRYFVDAYSMGWTEVRVTMRLPRTAQIVPADDPECRPVTVKHKDLHVPHEESVRVKMPPEEIRIAKTRRILLATYGCFSMGANVPRLDGGIDLSPRATGEQQIGRIRRYLPGKRRPLWITPIDSGISLFEGFAEARCREYRLCNVKVMSYAKVKKSSISRSR